MIGATSLFSLARRALYDEAGQPQGRGTTQKGLRQAPAGERAQAANMDNYDANAEKAENNLKPLLTDEFLETLRIAVKTCGWSVDHIESSEFVNWCFSLVGKENPDTEPFNYDDR